MLSQFFIQVKSKLKHSFQLKKSKAIAELERVCDPKEIDQVESKKILIESFIGEYQKYLQPDDIKPGLTSWRDGEKSVQQYYENYFAEEFKEFAEGLVHYWVQVKVDGKLAGWATFLREKTDANAVYMNLLVVLPEYQGQGIGRQLVFALKDLNVLPEQETVNLLLRKKNLGGKIFYEKLGFHANPDYKRDNFVDVNLLEGYTWRNPELVATLACKQ